MRIVKAEFQRLLGFKSVSLDIDHQLQLIAGPNNAGKSTLVRLLELFFSDPSEDQFVAAQPLNKYYASEGSRSLSTITVHFGDLGEEEETLFANVLRRNKTFSITLTATRRGKISYKASKNPGVDEARRLYDEVLSRFHFVKIPSVRMTDGKGSDTDSLERLLDTLEAVLVRKGRARSTALQQAYAELVEPLETMVSEVLDESAVAIKDDLPFQENTVSFRLPDSSHALRAMLAAAVIESQGAVTVPVAQRGTGFQSALVLGILRYVAQRESQSAGDLFFAVEEPEAFLHPQTQRAMAKIIRDIASSAQVLVTTHSSVLVDSFKVDQIARLPLQPAGLEHQWHRPELKPTDVGRLTRHCSASNSELVFANAVVFVEGESDFGVVEDLLGTTVGAPGGHYALGVTVIEAGGIDTAKYLLQLAKLFGVRAYVRADRDSLHKRDGKRALLEVLKDAVKVPDVATVRELTTESDKRSSDLKQALARQKRLNAMLKPFDAFVLAADLEGLLLDTFGRDALVAALGPDGHKLFDAAAASGFLADPDGYEQFASWLRSKGWNSDRPKSGRKLKPHWPPILIHQWMSDHANAPGEALAPLLDWLDQVIADAHLAPV